MPRRDSRMDTLKRVPLFARCSKGELRQIAAVAEEFEVQEGRDLTREGERGRHFAIILEGSALVVRKGRRVNRLRAGDFFGEIALVTGEPRTATVTAETPLRALVLNERDFRRVLRTTPSVTMKVLQALGRRLPDDRV
jgi:CRP-like cAMP-binding protein